MLELRLKFTVSIKDFLVALLQKFECIFDFRTPLEFQFHFLVSLCELCDLIPGHPEVFTGLRELLKAIGQTVVLGLELLKVTFILFHVCDLFPESIDLLVIVIC